MKSLIVILAAILLTGCASRHAYMSQPASLGPERWQCNSFHPNDCELVRDWQPSQLTPVGCWTHTIVTGGHIAWECRKPKNGNVPTSGRWIWRHKQHELPYDSVDCDNANGNAKLCTVEPDAAEPDGSEKP